MKNTEEIKFKNDCRGNPLIYQNMDNGFYYRISINGEWYKKETSRDIEWKKCNVPDVMLDSMVSI